MLQTFYPNTPVLFYGVIYQPYSQPLYAKSSDNFKTSIVEFVKYAENEPCQIYLLSTLCTTFNFQRRRFYDVMNVFEAIGCCQKISVDSVMWMGFSNIRNSLMKLAINSGVFDVNKKIDDIIPNESCISIIKLTQHFVLLFLALNTNRVEIKQAALFLSRVNNRLKTTLCKLYQIAHILETSGIIEKSVVPGEVKIKDQFFIEITQDSCQGAGSLSIESLLNKKEGTACSQHINKRREAYKSVKAN